MSAPQRSVAFRRVEQLLQADRALRFGDVFEAFVVFCGIGNAVGAGEAMGH